MRLIRCTQGHFFDADSYQVCPHCGSPAAGKTPAQPVPSHGNTQEKKSGRSFLSFGKKKEEKRAPVREVYGGPAQGIPGQGYSNPGRPGPGYPGQGMPVQGYPNAGMQGQNYPMQGGPVQSRPNQGMPAQGYVNPGSGQNGNPPVQTPGQSPVTGRTDSGNASQVFVQPSSSQPEDIVQKTYDIYGAQSTPNPSRPAAGAPQGQAGNTAVSYTPQAEVRPEPVQAPAPVQIPASPVQAEPEIPAAEPVPEPAQEENAPS
ncbi:MAG: hypothetical protein II781_02980, partial [Clostridia bacterium]|nr:hypothetical protein [Clostridia bacterium]